MADRLPIYRLQSEGTDVGRLVDLASRIFGIDQDFTLSENDSNRVLRSGQRVLEVAMASGGIWAADEERLWKPWSRPDLPDKTDALARADRLVRDRELLP